MSVSFIWRELSRMAAPLFYVIKQVVKHTYVVNDWTAWRRKYARCHRNDYATKLIPHHP